MPFRWLITQPECQLVTLAYLEKGSLWLIWRQLMLMETAPSVSQAHGEQPECLTKSLSCECEYQTY